MSHPEINPELAAWRAKSPKRQVRVNPDSVELSEQRGNRIVRCTYPNVRAAVWAIIQQGAL